MKDEHAKKITVSESEIQINGEPMRYVVRADDNPGVVCDGIGMGGFLMRCWANGSDIINDTDDSFDIYGCGKVIPPRSSWSGGQLPFGEWS